MHWCTKLSNRTKYQLDCRTIASIKERLIVIIGYILLSWLLSHCDIIDFGQLCSGTDRSHIHCVYLPSFVCRSG